MQRAKAQLETAELFAWTAATVLAAAAAQGLLTVVLLFLGGRPRSAAGFFLPRLRANPRGAAHARRPET
jgi:hypothetical protein